jgi:hypothetical protein
MWGHVRAYMKHAADTKRSKGEHFPAVMLLPVGSKVEAVKVASREAAARSIADEVGAELVKLAAECPEQRGAMLFGLPGTEDGPDFSLEYGNGVVSLNIGERFESEAAALARALVVGASAQQTMFGYVTTPDVVLSHAEMIALYDTMDANEILAGAPDDSQRRGELVLAAFGRRIMAESAHRRMVLARASAGLPPLEAKPGKAEEGRPELGQPTDLPPRDMSVAAQLQGVFRKYHVRRVDGRDAPGGDRHGDEHFVLNLTRDPHAVPAIAAYARSCEGEFPQLAKDLTEGILARDGGALETLHAMLDHGPLLSEDVPCKAGLATLLDAGFAVQIIGYSEHRYAATPEGAEAYCAHYGGNSLAEAKASRASARVNGTLAALNAAHGLPMAAAEGPDGIFRAVPANAPPSHAHCLTDAGHSFPIAPMYEGEPPAHSHDVHPTPPMGHPTRVYLPAEPTNQTE